MGAQKRYRVWLFAPNCRHYHDVLGTLVDWSSNDFRFDSDRYPGNS
jgi:hypothetical protein